MLFDTYFRDSLKASQIDCFFLGTAANSISLKKLRYSINLEWPEQVFNEIAIRILSFVGINLREPELAQYSEGKKQTGI